jgi:hypothetical protein
MTNVRVDPAAAHEVASAYLDARNQRDSCTEVAFAQLVAETDALYQHLTDSRLAQGVRIVFTICAEPYRNARELIDSVRNLRILEIATVAADADRRHPLMANDCGGEYDRFRAVHDVLGHARLQLGFDRDGEYVTWLAQERFHSPLARRALATERHGQHSVRWTTGQIAEPKATLLDESLVQRSRLVASSV